MNATLTFHTDPSHGWLEVSPSDLAAVGASTKDFSVYSYRNGRSKFFLEEDCDAPKFINLFKTKFGTEPSIAQKHHRGDFPEDYGLYGIHK